MISFLIKKLDRYRQHAISSSIDDLTICQNDDSETIKKKKNTFSKT
jgi:hypothetical protein